MECARVGLESADGSINTTITSSPNTNTTATAFAKLNIYTPAQEFAKVVQDTLEQLPHNKYPYSAVLRVLPYVPDAILSAVPNGSHGLPVPRTEPHLHLTGTTTEGSSEAIVKRAYEILSGGPEMEDLLVREQQTEQHVRDLMSRGDAPVGELLDAFKQYRQISEAHIFALFATPEANKVGDKLWKLHVDGKGFFKKHVTNLENQGANNAVAVRKLKMLFLQFIKAASVFYREFIYKLNIEFCGIPELEAAARRVKSDSVGESPPSAVSPEVRQHVLYTCHQALVSLGDLSRYRAAEKLDKKQDFGPAMGYYELAAVICPTKGHAHHQASMIALKQDRYMQATYHLYRSIVVAEPHELAGKNLASAFSKINRLWDKSELFKRNDPSDPESLKNKLIGLYLRFQALCASGRRFDSYVEFEQTIHDRLSAEVKARDLGSTLLRMVLVNISAQHRMSEVFQGMQ